MSDAKNHSSSSSSPISAMPLSSSTSSPLLSVSPESKDTIQIFVKSVISTKTVSITIASDNTVLDLYAAVTRHIESESDPYVLIWRGKRLLDVNERLSKLGIERESTLFILFGI